MHLKRRLVCPPGVSALDALNDSTWQRHLAEKIIVLSAFYIKEVKEISRKINYIQMWRKINDDYRL